MDYNKDKIYEVPINQIFADDSFNCRGPTASLKVDDLIPTIKQHGLTNPVTLQPWLNEDKSERISGKRFRLIAGHRRFRAHQILESQGEGFSTIRSVILEGLSEKDARIINLTENLARQDLTLDQEANALKPFLSWNPKLLSEKLGKSITWIKVRMNYLDLPADIQEEVKKGVVDFTQIEDLINLDFEQQYAYVRKIKDHKLKGTKKPPDPEKLKRDREKVRGKKIRTQEEMFEMQDILFQELGASLATKVLAWASGQIEGRDMHIAIRDEARIQGKFYAIPQQFRLVGQNEQGVYS